MDVERKYQIRKSESFLHAIEINKPYRLIDTIIDWAKNETIGEWRWQLVELSSHQLPGRYIFYFDNERDYLAFMLKWS